jgi:hypothetical protein
MTMKIITSILIFFILISCKDKNDDTPTIKNTCAVNEPLVDLPWLKEIIEAHEQYNTEIDRQFYIQQGLYNNKTVFVHGNCCVNCNTVKPVYTCEGQILFNLSNEEIQNLKLIWKPVGSLCTFN